MFLIYTDNKPFEHAADTTATATPYDEYPIQALNDQDEYNTHVMSLADIYNHPILLKSRKLATKEFRIREKIRQMTTALEEQIRSLVGSEPGICEARDQKGAVHHRDSAA
ncbi:MAG: hypothetical protein ABIK28_21735 [Planctomycetota bacterium]